MVFIRGACVFYLFSIVTSLQRLKRKNCAKAMLKCWSSREEAWSRRGKLVTPELKDKTKIWERFGPGSWLMFKLRDIDGKSFLKKPVKEWSDDVDYQKLNATMTNIKVVNDPAERAILLAKTLQGKLAYSDDERQKLILVIPHAREKLEKISKSNLLKWDFTNL